MLLFGLLVLALLLVASTDAQATFSVSYGVSTVIVSTNTIVLEPTHSVSVKSWSISPASATGVTFSAQTGALTLGPTVAAATLTIIATSMTPQETANATIVVQKGSVVAAPVKFLRLGLDNDVEFALHVPTLVPVYMDGSADACTLTPALPTGLAFDLYRGITGTPSRETDRAAYTLSCSNAASVTNVLHFSAAVSSNPPIENHLMVYYWRWTRLANVVPCNEIITPFNTPGADHVATVVANLADGRNFFAGATDLITSYRYGAVWSGYLNIVTAGDYSFGLSLRGGASLMIDGKMIIVSADCNVMSGTDAPNPTMTGVVQGMKPGYHPIQMTYTAITPGVKEFDIWWHQGADTATPFVQVPAERLAMVPMEPVIFTHMRMTYKRTEPVSNRVVVFGMGIVPSISGMLPEGLTVSDLALTGSISSPDYPTVQKSYPLEVVYSGVTFTLNVRFGVGDSTSSNNINLAYANSNGTHAILSGNFIRALVGWNFAFQIFPVGSYVIEGCPSSVCQSQAPSGFSSTILYGSCQAAQAQTGFTITAADSTSHQYYIECVSALTPSSWAFLAVKFDPADCGSYEMVDNNGRIIAGGSSATTSYGQITTSGAYVPPGDYSVKLAAGNCIGSFAVLLDQSSQTHTVMRNSMSVVKMSTMSLSCPSEGEKPLTAVGGKYSKSCAVTETGSITFYCNLEGGVPKWSGEVRTCKSPSIVTMFHYGLTNLTLGARQQISLKPFYTGDIKTFSISPTIQSGSLNATTGEMMFNNIQTGSVSTTYTISALFSGTTVASTSLTVTLTQLAVGTPVKNLQLTPLSSFQFVSGLPMSVAFTTDGSRTSCQMSPSAPNGVVVDTTGISGTPMIIDLTVREYRVFCLNSYSKTNEVIFSSAVHDKDVLAPGLLAKYWKYIGPAASVPCQSMLDPQLDTTITELKTEKVDLDVQHEAVDTIWPGLGTDFQDNWGVSWSGYVLLDTASTYTFSLQSSDGSILYVDGKIASSNGGCHDFDQRSQDSPMDLTAGYHAIRVNYFNGMNPQGFYLKYRTSQTVSDLIPATKLFHVPPTQLSFSVTRDTLALNAAIPTIVPTLLIQKATGYTVSPSLPSGLTMNAAGNITGTPTTSSSMTQHVVTATTTGAQVKSSLFLSVNAYPIPSNVRIVDSAAPTVPLTTASLFPGQMGTYKVMADGTILNYESLSTLPSGFIFSPTSGELTGTCSTSFNRSFSFSARNIIGAATGSFRLVCLSSCPTGKESLMMTLTTTGELRASSVTVSLFGSGSATPLLTLEVSAFSSAPSAAACVDIDKEYSYQGLNKNTFPVTLEFKSYSFVHSSLGLPLALGGKGSLFRGTVPFTITAPELSFTKPDSIHIPGDVMVKPTMMGFASSCTSTPALPGGLSIDPHSCVISGRATDVAEPQIYTITAKNAKGSKPATVELEVKDCSDEGKLYYELLYYTGDVPTIIAWEFGHEGNLWLEVNSTTLMHTAKTTYRFTGCMEEKDAHLLTRVRTATYWETAYVNITVLGKFLGRHAKPVSSTGSSYLLTQPVSVLISPVRTFKYTHSIPVDSAWYEKLYADTPWDEVTISALPPMTGNSSFLLTSFTAATPRSDVPSFTVLIGHAHGVIFYVNGQEFYRRFVPRGPITETSTATGGFGQMTTITLVLPISMVKTGLNTVAFAVIRRTTDAATFRVSVQGMLDAVITECLPYTNLHLISQSGHSGTGEDASNAIDGNPDTDWTELLSRNPGSVAWVTLGFPTNYYAWVNSYGMRSSKKTDSEGRPTDPLGMNFQGYQTSWTTMGDPAATENVGVTVGGQTLTWNHFSEKTLFNRINVTVKSTKGVGSDMRLAELMFSTCIVNYCMEDGNFIGGKAEETVYASCPMGWLGLQTRMCGSGFRPSWGPIDDSLCTEGPPANFSYPSPSYTFSTFLPISTLETTPYFVSVLPYTFSVLPPPPLGVTVNATTGAIQGTPEEDRVPMDYTVTIVNNQGGLKQTHVTIATIRRACPPDGDWVGTPADKLLEILCPAGMVGTRTRFCRDGAIPIWDPADESKCTPERAGSAVPTWVIAVISVLAVIGVSVLVMCVWIRVKARNSRRKGGKFGSMRLGGSSAGGHGKSGGFGAASGGSSRSMRVGAGGASQKTSRSIRL